APDAPGTPGCADSHSADTGQRAHASPRPPVHCAAPAATRSAMSTLPLTAARTLVGSIGRVHIRRRPGDDARARLPFFCRDLLHHLDLKIPLRNQLLELRVLLLELTQALHI